MNNNPEQIGARRACTGRLQRGLLIERGKWGWLTCSHEVTWPLRPLALCTREIMCRLCRSEPSLGSARSRVAHLPLAAHRCQDIPEHLFVIYFFTKFISEFITFSPNLVANHTHISPITPPTLLDPPRAPHPWRPQLGSRDPESGTPSPSRILSPVCCNSRCPRRL